MKIKIKKLKKAQHEIVGFVLIIVIVAVVGLIFLSFSVGKGSETKTSRGLSDFIQSSMYYTTDCKLDISYENLQDLIKECVRNSGKRCLNDERVCDVLNETLSELVRGSLDVNDNGLNKAFKLDIYYKDRIVDEVLSFEEGLFKNCSSIIGAKQPIPLDTGNINFELELCKG